jgi:hypothetical protein
VRDPGSAVHRYALHRARDDSFAVTPLRDRRARSSCIHRSDPSHARRFEFTD